VLSWCTKLYALSRKVAIVECVYRWTMHAWCENKESCPGGIADPLALLSCERTWAAQRGWRRRKLGRDDDD
jgi:hypothetical protein